MYHINKNYLHLFKKIQGDYCYPVKRGLYLSFDSDTLEMIDIKCFYTIYDYGKTNRLCEEKILYLMARDIIF